MPFLKDFIINDYTKIMTWRIKPGELSINNLDKQEKILLESKKSLISKEQFLGIRNLLKMEDTNLKINYDVNGKPYLNKNMGISISHSNELVALGLSNEINFGIDIQHKTEKIYKIQSKFLSEKEKKNLGNNAGIDSLIRIWSAKESVYKSLGIKGVSFSKELEIKVNSIKDDIKTGYYFTKNSRIKFDLSFFSIENYIICYAKESY